MPSPIALPYAEGTFLFATRGMTGATGNWYCGLHEVDEMAFVLHLLQPDEHFLDVGANVGSYSILVGGAARARVTAVEPIPATFMHLQRNVVLNRLDEHLCYCQAGLSDVPGVLRFSVGLDTVNHVLVEGEDLPGADVPVMRLDDLVGQGVPHLIKIDVEGHELAVLHGCSRTLRDARPLAVIMETNGNGARCGVADDALIALMRECGFAPFGYEPFQRLLKDSVPANRNTVFVRDRGAVEERCRAARKFRLVKGVI
jgi:FkbM family methyltransferase